MKNQKNKIRKEVRRYESNKFSECSLNAKRKNYKKLKKEANYEI